MSNDNIHENGLAEDEAMDILTLSDEEGNEIDFELLDVIEYDGNEYVILLPVDDDGSDGVAEVVILLLESESDDEQSFAVIEDPAVELAVFNLFKDRYADEITFVDTDE